MPSFDETKRPLRIGDRAEYQGEVVWVEEILERRAYVRHENGRHTWEFFNKLTWLPAEADMEAQAASIRRESLAEKRRARGPNERPDGNPKTAGLSDLDPWAFTDEDGA